MDGSTEEGKSAGVEVLAHTWEEAAAARASSASHASAACLVDLYAKWASDPASVDPNYAELFTALSPEARALLAETPTATWSPGSTTSQEDASEDDTAREIEALLEGFDGRLAAVNQRLDRVLEPQG